MIREIAFMRVVYTLESPLSIGSGKADTTDHDVILDHSNQPIVPATSLAGIFRHAVDEHMAGQLFGFIDGQRAKRSPVAFSDGTFTGKANITMRDGIRLDDYKTACDSAKYDYEVIDTGASFVADIEIRLDDEDLPMAEVIAVLDSVIAQMNQGEVRLGFKTNRGLGKLSAKRAVKVFSTEDLIRSLDFTWEEAEIEFNSPGTTLCKGYHWLETQGAHVRGGISVRQYSTLKGQADFAPLKVNDETVVIPGSSVAGVLINQARRLLRELGCTQACMDGLIRSVFGGEQDSAFVSSACIVEEASVTGGRLKTMTRTKVDRFTSSAAHGALFTEEVQIHGDTTLRIGVPREEWIVGLLILAFKDVQNGIVAFGGSTSIGRGLIVFENLCVDGNALTPEEEKKYLQVLGMKISTVREEEGHAAASI